MNRKLAVAEPFLTERHRKMIREAAEKQGFEVRIMDSPEEDRNFLNEAEVIFGQAPETANYDKNAYNTGDILPSGGFDAKQ